MGYGTPAHLSGIRSVGPCPHHRLSFAPVSRLALGLAGRQAPLVGKSLPVG